MTILPNDQYGRAVTSQDNGDGTTTYAVYDSPGVVAFTLIQPSSVLLDQVYQTINSMTSA